MASDNNTYENAAYKGNINLVNTAPSTSGSSVTSILNARKTDELNKSAFGSDLVESGKQLDTLIKKFDELGIKTKSATKIVQDMRDTFTSLNKQAETHNISTLDAYNGMIKLLEEYKKGQDAIYQKEAQLLTIERDRHGANTKAYNEAQGKLTKLSSEQSDINDDILSQIEMYKSFIETNKSATKSLSEQLGNKISSVKKELGRLQVMKSLSSAADALSGDSSSSTSLTAVSNAVRSQYGITKSEFQTFKNSLLGQLNQNGLDTKFAWKDTANYLNNLDKLGITSQDVAEQQYLAIMEGTKYLGQSTETQAAILKNARLSGNMNLLDQSNKQIVKILNAQLGVSREQLDTMTNEAASMSLLTGGTNTLSFQKQLAVLGSKYGEDASSALSNIVTSMLQGDTSYASYLGEAGMDYGTTVSRLQNGDSSVLYDIFDALKNSSYAKTRYNYAAYDSSMALDSNMLNILNSTSKTDKTLSELASLVDQQSGDTTDYVNSQTLTWQEQVSNFISNIGALLPEWWSLANIYYSLSIAELLTKMPDVFKFFNNSSGLLSGMSKTLGTGITGGGLTLAGGIVGGLSVIAGLTMGVADGIDAMSKAKEWGTSKSSAAVGGFLGGTDTDTGKRIGKNALKGALIGAGIGLIFGGPAGMIIGGLIGGIAGLTLGAIGGQNIATGIDSLFNGSSTSSSSSKIEGDAYGAPTTSLSYSGRGASSMGDLVSKKDFPWTLTSPFGYRGVIQTSAGPTNPFHTGIDLASAQGTPIGANRAGTVSASGTATDGANYVIVNDGSGYEEVYWHLMKPSALKKGDHVNMGQLIGYMGMTGHATGPHLHFGMRYAGKTGQSAYIDPINTVNSEMFNPTDSGYQYTANASSTSEEGRKLLQKIVSSDTLSTEAAQDIAYSGVGESSDNIVTSINSGFSGLIEKIDSLSTRQDEQEEMLKVLSSGTTNKGLYKF